MPCGCVGTCNCNIVQGDGIHVLVAGNTFTVSNTAPMIGAPSFISQADPGALGYSYVWYEVDGAGALVATHVVAV